MTSGPVAPITLRYVQVLRALGHPVETVAAVTGCPPRLVAEMTVGSIDTLRDDLALIAIVDTAREHDAARPSPSDTELADTARFLADASGSPRYGTEGLGWSALLGSEANIEHATRAALARLGGAFSPVDIERLNAARALLLRHAAGGDDARS